ncbi:hypothetical protein SASPL_154806 [Salvia splendens]|uniref:Cupin type-1 domain-containing protein n=1 Tax=Salvia splendens TaxID=180675 RepID=A0A8X8W0Q7_SALSN|nr:hypothetical protein SASPL_154806 [Salvia splendens]
MYTGLCRELCFISKVMKGLRSMPFFANSNDDLREPATEPYSSIQDMVLGFDKTILQATFKKTIENCNGWSTVVTEKQLTALEGSSIGLFVVKLKAGSMMEPHWNAMDTEVVVVLEGRGMVRLSSPSVAKGRVMRLEVEQGDVFVVPRFNQAAQMAFISGSFPWTLDELLAARNDTIISPCISCAEEEEVQILEQGEREEEGGRRRHHGGGGRTSKIRGRGRVGTRRRRGRIRGTMEDEEPAVRRWR